MSGIWESFKSFFKASENSSSSNPLIHEVIQRSPEEIRQYEDWKKTLVKRRLLDWLHQQYVNFLINPLETDEAIDFLDTPSSKGFVIHLSKTGYTFQDAVHFLDFLKEQVLKLNYKSYISDLKSYQKQDWVETLQRHYLKPRISSFDKPVIRQEFGNITIELLLRNEQLVNLKFRANSYQDRKFAKAEDFGELIQEILNDE